MAYFIMNKIHVPVIPYQEIAFILIYIHLWAWNTYRVLIFVGDHFIFKLFTGIWMHV